LHAHKLIRTLSNGLSVSGLQPERIGIDLVHIPRIEASLQRFGDRFVARLFTPAEGAYARSGSPPQRAERLAARFAAKEAAIKAFCLAEAGVDWKDLEVLRHDDGSCSLALHGRALEAARAQGLARGLVSLSHDGDYAAAVVAALSDKTAIAGSTEFTT
jgi:holo-[acyl-carrier protein] synthase